MAIELDGVQYHLNRESFVSDPPRRNGLTVAGWKVLTFTWDDYINHPGGLCEAIAGACFVPSRTPEAAVSRGRRRGLAAVGGLPGDGGGDLVEGEDVQAGHAEVVQRGAQGHQDVVGVVVG